MLLAAALVYTSFSASSEARLPSQLARAPAGTSYQLTGRVVDGSIERTGSGALRFEVRDSQGRDSVPVVYAGVVPDPFRDGRDIIVNVRREGDVFVGERDTLLAKCPSKFTTEPQQRQS